MTRRRKQRLLTTSCALCALLSPLGKTARAALTPVEMEKEVLRISRQLQPVPDSVWEEVAGEQAEERYAIVQGDTLYDISKRLFGDSKYWPKIWAINNHSILNPHMIRPGVQIAFRGGTGTDVPMVALVSESDSAKGQRGTVTLEETGEEPDDAPAPREAASKDTADAADAADEDKNIPFSEPDARPVRDTRKKKRKSAEWMRLPAQRWERSAIRVRRVPVKEDFALSGPAIGSERKGLTFDQTMIVASEPMEELGEITSTTALGSFPTLLETVFIRTERALQVGKIYAITASPDPIIPPQPLDGEPQPQGYGFPYLGKVKIIDHKDDTYVGTVISSHDAIERGNRIVALPPAIGELEPMAMSKPLEAAVILDHRHAAGLAAESSLVYLNRGSTDGVKPGHVFRITQRSDRKTHVIFGASPPDAYAEMIVIQVSERYSAAVVTRSTMPIEEFEIATALVGKEAVKDAPVLAPEPTPTQATETNELDQFQQNDQLKPQEKKDLDQLEKWKANPSPLPSPAPSPTPSPVPTPDTTPSPAPEPAPTPSPAPEPAPTPSPSEMPPLPPAEPTPVPSATDPATDTLPPPPSDMLSAPPAAIPTEAAPVPTSNPAIPADPNADLPPPPPF